MARTNRVSGSESLVRGVILFGAGLLAMAVGCGDSADFPTGRVHGRVTFEGSPVSEGVVSVYSAELGVGASAELGADGTFTIAEPLRTGKYAIAILPPETPPEELAPATSTKTNGYPDIPAKYRDPEKSELFLDLKTGDNTLDVDMTK